MGATSLTYSGDQVDAGTYYVTAHYAGDANHDPSDGDSVAIQIVQAGSTVTVAWADGPAQRMTERPTAQRQVGRVPAATTAAIRSP